MAKPATKLPGMQELSSYEEDQLTLIKKWRLEEPSVASKVVGTALSPISWLVEKVVPEASIRGALDFSNQVAEWLADSKDIIRDSEVSSIAELRSKDLKLSDKIADEVHNWSIGIGATEGGVTGAAGLPGVAADIPLIITIALRTVHKIGLCYGYECATKEDKDFILGIMAASSANDMKSKIAALSTLRAIEVTIAKESWKAMAKVAASEKLSKEAGIIAIKTLSKQLGINLTKRKALQFIPIIGAGVGATVNGWYLKEVGWAARRAFQERWLIDNKKVIDI